MAMVNYIKDIRSNKLVIYCIDNALVKFLIEMGGHRGLFDRNKFELNVGSKNLLADSLMKLRDAGFHFAGGSSGWHPAAVFEHLRAEGLVNGKINVVVWKGKGEFHIEDGR